MFVTFFLPQKFGGVILAESKSSEIHQGKTDGEGSENSNHEQVDILYFICFINSKIDPHPYEILFLGTIIFVS